jgi:aspartyl aminopeptidase
MSKEEKKVSSLEKELFYVPEYPADKNADLMEQACAFCEGYKAFLNTGKTEREAAEAGAAMLMQAGYEPYSPDVTYQPGDKVYFINRQKALIAATIGTAPLDEGFHLNIAHIDSPRLDLKPVPLYEKSHFSLLKTHYYGGLRKYQWPTIPLAIHGVFCKADGETVKVCIGEAEDDPVFCITDLLPHLSKEQNDRKLSDGIRGEELNVLIGSAAVDDPDVKEAVKLNAMVLLHQKYGIVERDFARAEIEIVPAFRARDVGLDRSMIGAYGQDDRVDAYPALQAEIACKAPHFTTVCVLTDKEETGSEGVTGMQSSYVFHFLQQLCQSQHADPIRALQNSKCLSADVTAAYDPSWDSAYEPMNGTYAGRGIAVFKYTGAAGKSMTSDANAELVGYVTRLCDAAGVAWQIGEMGRVDLGGGGTIAKFVARHDIDTLDIGVPVLSMHSPFEVTHKLDILMAYKTFLAFNEAEQ